MNVFVKTNIGLRENNEDSYYVDPNHTFLILADGMGGHAAGEKASEMAVTLLKKKLSKNIKNETNLLNLINTSIQEVNKRIYEESLSNIKYRGMGTTLSLVFYAFKSFYYVNIGDSRIYKLKGKKLLQLSKDDSFVNYLLEIGDITEEEARVHPKKNILTKALGTSEGIDFVVKVIDESEVDKLLLCSDGLSDILENREIEMFLSSGKMDDEKLDFMIKDVLKNGGKDNITIIVLERK